MRLLIAVALLVLACLPASAQGPGMIGVCATRADAERGISAANPGIRLVWIGGGDAANVVRSINGVQDSVLVMADGVLAAEPAGEPVSRLYFFWRGCLVAWADVERAWLAGVLGEGV